MRIINVSIYIFVGALESSIFFCVSYVLVAQFKHIRRSLSDSDSKRDSLTDCVYIEWLIVALCVNS